MNINRMCIFDLDGTLDLTDAKLSAEIYKLSKMGVAFVAATGRTNEYVKETCKKHNIIPPRYIIADNGGSIYDNIKQEYIKRTSLPTDTRTKLIEEYLRLGGNLENVRYTNGENVYAVENAHVRKYYELESIIEYKSEEELYRAILEGKEDITKITLARK